MLKLCVSVCLFLLTITAYGQVPFCGTDSVRSATESKSTLQKMDNILYDYQQSHPSKYSSEKKDSNHLQGKIESGLSSNTLTCDTEEKTLIIPIVFHVIYKTSDKNYGSGTNISDSYIFNILDDLNNAFRNTGKFKSNPSNPHPAVQSVDVNIQFVLAYSDITGSDKYFKTASGRLGICRWPSDSFSKISTYNHGRNMNQYIAAQCNNEFPTTHYVNFYIVPSINFAAGYATYPTSYGSVFDGIVCDALGSRTTVHEMGHYLYLYHTFEGGCTNATNDCLKEGDRVCDTPPTDDNNSSAKSCINGCNNDAVFKNSPFTTDQTDLCENYMSYASVPRNTFTSGQKVRMRGTLETIRSTLLTSKARLKPGYVNASLEIASRPNIVCDSTVDLICAATNTGLSPIDSFTIRLTDNGKYANTFTIKKHIPVDSSYLVNLNDIPLTIGYHHLDLEISSIDDGDSMLLYNHKLCTELYRSDKVNHSVNETFEESFHSVLSGNSAHDLGFKIDTVSRCNSDDSLCVVFQSFDNIGVDRNSADYLYLPVIQTDSFERARLYFDRSYVNMIANSQYNTVLTVDISTDCWQSYSTVFSKTKDDLATRKGDYYLPWKPDTCSDWLRDTLILDSLCNYPQFHVRFRVDTDSFYSGQTPKFGNNLYLDNINLAVFNCRSDLTIISDSVVCDDTFSVQVADFNEVLWGNNSTNHQIQITNSDTLTVRVLDQYNCYHRDSAVIEILGKPALLSHFDTAFCGDSLAFNFENIDTVLWNNGTNDKEFTLYQSDTLVGFFTLKNGCSGQDSVGVLLEKKPEKPIIQLSNDTLFTDSKADNHIWFLKGYSNYQSKRNYVKPYISGDFRVVASNINGCSDTSDWFYYRNASITTSVANSVIVYPNPFRTSFNIQLPSSDFRLIKLVNVLGQPVDFVYSRKDNVATIQPEVVHNNQLIFIQISNGSEIICLSVMRIE